jgi:endonuclease YncB( thermonuclease family)
MVARPLAVSPPPPGLEVVDHVADGDTIVLAGGVTVRLAQIDTPEAYLHPECRHAASPVIGICPFCCGVRRAH